MELRLKIMKLHFPFWNCISKLWILSSVCKLYCNILKLWKLHLQVLWVCWHWKIPGLLRETARWCRWWRRCQQSPSSRPSLITFNFSPLDLTSQSHTLHHGDNFLQNFAGRLVSRETFNLQIPLNIFTYIHIYVALLVVSQDKVARWSWQPMQECQQGSRVAAAAAAVVIQLTQSPHTSARSSLFCGASQSEKQLYAIIIFRCDYIFKHLY